METVRPLAADAPHHFDPTLLREYDIRGVVGQTLSLGDAQAVGRAFGTVARRRGGRTVAVGYDGRHSSPMLAQAVADGLVAAGIDALDIGRGPTPMLYFASHTLDVDGGVMVTGSHNPPSYNGFKLVLEKAPFFGADIQALGTLAASADYESGRGSVGSLSVFDAYVESLLASVAGRRSLKVAWDAGNGATGEVLAAVVARLPGEHVLLNERIDGDFPNHHPDPTVPENLQQLQAAVRAEGCDLGIAFDGDGDRLGVVDAEGRILWGDQILLFLARDLLKRAPGATIIGDVKCSQVLFDGIASAGGVPLMWKTGHSLIKAEMKRRAAPLAGEMSGHIFFEDCFGYDDGLYAALRLLSILQSTGESLARFRASLPPVVSTPEIRVPCAEDRKWKVVEAIRARQSAAGTAIDAIDGVRVRQGSGWWLLRASNTQDILVVRCEAATREDLDEIMDFLRRELADFALELPDGAS